MELQQILDKMVEPEKLVDGNEIVLVSQYVSEFIDHYQELIYEQKIRVSEEWVKVRELVSSDTKANAKQQGMPEHRKLHELERLEDRLRRFRSDLKDKLQIIARTKGF